MPDSLDVINPIAAVLRTLTAEGGQTVEHVYTLADDFKDTLRKHSWRVGISEREIDSHIGGSLVGRYRESLTAVCDYYAATTARQREAHIDEARRMQDAAIRAFSTRTGLVLADGIIISAIDPGPVGSAQVGNDTWAVSQLEITATRWVDYVN